MTQLCGQKNEVGFKCQRSLLQLPMKPASLGIEACCVFETILDRIIKEQKKAPSKFAWRFFLLCVIEKCLSD